MQPILSSYVYRGVGRISTNRSHNSRHWWGGDGTLNWFLLHFTYCCWGGKCTNTSTGRWDGIWWCHYKHMVNKYGWTLFCADVVTNLPIVYSEVETEKSTETTCFSRESHVYRWGEEGMSMEWMFCPTYAGNYIKLLCWQFVHFLDYPEDQDSKLRLIVSNYFPIDMVLYARQLQFLASL